MGAQLQPHIQTCPLNADLSAQSVSACHTNQVSDHDAGQILGLIPQPAARAPKNKSDVSFETTESPPLKQGPNLLQATPTQSQAGSQTSCRDAVWDMDAHAETETACSGQARAPSPLSAAAGWQTWAPLPVAAPSIPGLQPPHEPLITSNAKPTASAARQIAPEDAHTDAVRRNPAGIASDSRSSEAQP